MLAQGKKRGVSSSRLELLKAKLQEYLAKEECYKKSSPKILAKCYMNIIDIYTDLAQFDKALDYGRLQLALARALQDHIDELRVINSIGRIYLLQGQCSTEPEKAKISFNNAENTLNTGIELLSSFKHELKNPETFNMKARLFLNISIVQEQLGHIDKALENVWRATMICNSENLFDVLYQCHYNEARFLFKKMDFSTALNCCTKALEVVKKLKDEARKYDTLSLKAKILCKLSDYENAKRIYLKAYKLNSQLQIDDHDDVIGNLKAAATMCYSRDLLTQYNSSGSVNHIASKTLYETLGDGACHFKNYDEAVNHYIKSLYHAETAGVSEKLLIPIYVSLYQTYKDMESYDMALLYFIKEYKLVKDEPKEAYSTLVNYADTMFLAKKPYDEIEKICLDARNNAKKLNDKNFEIRILKLLLKYKKKYNKEDDDIFNTISDLKLLGCDKDLDNLEEDQMTVSGCEETTQVWDDVSLDDFTDPSDTSDEEFYDNFSRNIRKGYTLKRNEEGKTKLHLAIMNGSKRYRQVKSLLAEGHPVNVKDNIGRTPLHQAALTGHVEIAKLLIKCRADVNDNGNPEGLTPLHCACLYGYLKLVMLLLYNGADPSLKTNSGKSSKDLLQEWHSSEELSVSNETLYNNLLASINKHIDEDTADN